MEENKIIENVIKKYELFLSESDLITEIQGDHDSLINLVTNSFPKNQFKKLTLDNYCIGKGNEESFSYLLERGTEKLGNIRGATASKFGVYYSRKNNGYKYTSKFNNQNHAIELISESINSVANADNLNIVAEDEILSHMFKYKIFYIYNPEKIIPIFSENLLSNSYTGLGFEYKTYIEAQDKLIEIFGSVENKNKSTLNFMYFLLGRYSFGNIIKNVISELTIESEQVYNVLISLIVNNFLIFSGPSGIGKTSIVKAISDNIGGKMFKLPIKSNFTDESSILGYWNPLLSKYEGTESLKFLIESYKNSDVLYFFLLDEMNLSKVENYFSTFLSEIDNLKDGEKSILPLFETQITTKKQYENIKYFLDIYLNKSYSEFIDFFDGKEDFADFYNKEIYHDDGNIKNEYIKNIKVFLPLSKNLKIIGTINEDETTQVLSNKVLDRSQFIHFEVGNLFEKIESNVEGNLLKRNFYELLENNIKFDKLLAEGVEIFGNENFEIIKELLNNLNIEIQKININESIGYRSLEEILNYINNYIGEGKITFDQALDNQITQKILTKLKIFSLINKDQKVAFKNISDLIKNYSKSTKCYNHLKSNSNLDD